MINQNKKIEEFLTEVVCIFKETQNKSTSFYQKVLDNEGELGIVRKELKESFEDLESRYEYFQENVQKDVELLLRSQSESSNGLESFAKMIDQRSNAIETACQTQIEELAKEIKEIPKNLENGQAPSAPGLQKEDLDILQEEIKRLERSGHAQNKEFAQLKSQLNNFRNEMNTLLVDNENEYSKKITELSNGIVSLSRQLGVRNPLI